MMSDTSTEEDSIGDGVIYINTEYLNGDSESNLQGNYPNGNKTTEDKSTNTDDTIKLIPYEVDHWASRCIRFADEFQSCHSEEDAQSSIADLDESLDRYLTLSGFDGDLRVDILLYCILSNVLEGLQKNSTLFSPSSIVTSVVTKSLASSGRLGRYGFQSLKQGLKTLKFLLEFYEQIEPEERPKCPIILWQSVKKIGVTGSTLFPALFPGDHDQWQKFHGENCPSACCKSVRVDFSSKGNPVILKHSFTTDLFLDSLKILLQNGEFFYNPENPIVLNTIQNTSRTSPRGKLEDICLHPMISCDIDILSSNSHLIRDIIQSQPQYKKALDSSNIFRKGSVVLRWVSRHFDTTRNPGGEIQPGQKSESKPQFHTLGMKQCGAEHLQSVLVDFLVDLEVDQQQDALQSGNFESLSSFGSVETRSVEFQKLPQSWLIIDQTSKKIAPSGRILDINEFKWDLKFGSCPSGCWTRAEVLFLDKLEIFPLLEECHVTFEDHICTIKCADCILQEKEIFVDKILKEEDVAVGVKVEAPKSLIKIPQTQDVSLRGREFARWKFAMSLPPPKREILKGMQTEFVQRRGKGFFDDEDFEQMLRIWEQNKDFYYSRWRTTQ